ncbi:hypothetical protein BJ994_000099 [Arthrobacter pigmenti]|uniref:Uncharacterized protein n=1 Tax=Arthrobacter pigmenti TaxID=271432 RepID=A0A846RDF4_9MICC|nr:hypothetical protein [Arthrobacter pigmenti]
MEIVVVLVLVAALAAVVLRSINRDGVGHTAPIESHSGWGSSALPSRSYSDPTAEGA